MFTPIPTSATMRMVRPGTSTGDWNRCAASQTTQTTPIRMASAFRIAAMIVARPRRQVWARDRRPFGQTAQPPRRSASPATSVEVVGGVREQRERAGQKSATVASTIT